MPSTFFGFALVQLRERLGLTKYQIVKGSRLDKALYSKTEAGRAPTDSTLQKLAPVFQMSVMELKRLTVDDAYGPDDIRAVTSWAQYDDADRLRRLTKEFWQSLDHWDFLVQVDRLYKAAGFCVELVQHPPEPFAPNGDLLMRIGGKSILADIRLGQEFVDREQVLRLEEHRVLANADEGCLITTGTFHRGAKEVATELPVKLIAVDDLITLQQETPPYLS